MENTSIVSIKNKLPYENLNICVLIIKRLKLYTLNSLPPFLWVWTSFPGSSVVKNLPASRRLRFDAWVRKIPWRREWQPTPVFLPRKSHSQRSLAGYIVHGVTKSQIQILLSHLTTSHVLNRRDLIFCNSS